MTPVSDQDIQNIKDIINLTNNDTLTWSHHCGKACDYEVDEYRCNFENVWLTLRHKTGQLRIRCRHHDETITEASLIEELLRAVTNRNRFSYDVATAIAKLRGEE